VPLRFLFACLSPEHNLAPLLHRPQAEQLSESAIKAFKYNFEKLTSGANLNIPEADIDSVTSLPSYETLSCEIRPPSAALTHQLACAWRCGGVALNDALHHRVPGAGRRRLRF